MTPPYRRIVTGHDAQGRSVVVSDGPTPNQFGPPDDPILVNFWATGGDATDPAEAFMPLGPLPGGATFRFFRVPPERATAHLSDDQRRAGIAAYYRQVGAGDAHVPEGRHPGFHRTASVDFIVLLAGEITLMLDEGEVEMRPFDVVVQRGTNHSWVNHGDTPALMMAVLVDANEAAGRA